MKKKQLRYFLIITIMWLIFTFFIVTNIKESIYQQIIFSIYFLLSIIYIVILFDKKLLEDIRREIEIKKKVNKMDYYRDKLDDYSPLMCSKLLGKKLYDKDSITSMILYLREKDYIEIGENNTFIIKNRDLMREHEIFFVENSKFIFTDLYHKTNTKYSDRYNLLEYLEKLVNDDLINEGLIKDEINKIGIQYIDMLPFIYIIVSVIILLKPGQISVYTTNIITFIFFIVNVSWMTIYIIHTILKLSLKRVKTDIGYEYTIKLLSQKKFLKEFSTISKRSLKEEPLWEYYIRAAILFDLKGVLDDDAEKFYKHIIKNYGYDESFIKSNKLDAIIPFILYLPWIFMIIVSDGLFQIVFSSIIILPIIYNILLKMDYKCLNSYKIKSK